MAAKLFVGNLSFQATEEDLRELFAQAGNVETVRIITDQFTGRPRGFGFVEMATKEEAQKAVEMLNGRLFRDRNLVVDEARPQPQRGAGGGFALARPPEQIAILEIIEAIDGRIALQRCLGEVPDCERMEGCALCSLLEQAQDRLKEVFGRTSLADLAARHVPVAALRTRPNAVTVADQPTPFHTKQPLAMDH